MRTEFFLLFFLLTLVCWAQDVIVPNIPLPQEEKTDTITKVQVITDDDVWNYIYELELVSEKTKDEAFLAPTSLLTGKTWLLKPTYQSRYDISYSDEEPVRFGIGEGPGVIGGKLIFKPNGTYNVVRTFRAESTKNKWEVTYSGIWTRYKKEYICMKANASNVRLRCIEYQGTPYQQLSARQKSNVDDKIVEKKGKIRKNILEEQSRTVKTDYGIKPNYKFVEYPNTEIRSRCERLDGYFLVLGLHEYVNEAKFYEIYEKGIK